MASVRKKALEDFAKDVEMGMPFAEDYIKKTGDVYQDALKARNLSEEALAQKVLDNTGIAIPDKTAPLSKKEDFLNRILQQNYPELEPNVRFEDMNDAVGKYNKGQISLNKILAPTRDIQKLTSDVLHEGGHSYDDIKKIVPEISQDDFNKELRKLKASGFDLKNADPAQVYELIAGKHHAQIPNLREGTFGLGALKSYLKSGTFKAIPYVGTALAGAAALSSPDVSAAAADLAIPGGLESLSPSKEDAAIENPQANPAARKAALEKLMGK
jgi:hypothetical protein